MNTKFEKNKSKRKIHKIEDICDYHKGKELSKKMISEEGKYPMILYGEIFMKYFWIVDKIKSRTNFNLGTLSKKGDILIPDSTTTKVNLHKAISLQKENIRLGIGIHILRKKNNLIYLSSFLSIYLRKIKKKEIERLSQGVTIFHIYKKHILNLNITLPPLKEQRKIVEILDHFSNHIKLIKKQIKILERIKTKSMDLIFTKGLKGEETEYCEESKQEKPKSWEIKKTEDVFNVKTGSTPSTNNKKYWENGSILWATPKDMGKISENYIQETEKRITKKALHKLNLVPKGSILISTRAPVGYTLIVNKKLTFNQGCKALVKKNNLITELFFKNYLDMKKDFLNQISSGSTFKELSKQALSKFCFPFPKISEQKEIANIFSSFDDLIEIKKKKLRSLERIFNYFCEELLSGRVRVVEE